MKTEGKNMKVGVFTDLHYADRENDTERFFQNVPEKLERCIHFFKEEKVDFLFCLGDLLDIGRRKEQQEQRLMQIYKLMKESGIPLYICLGNHDVDAFPWQKIMELFLPGQKKGYYSFDWEQFHFVVLDTNYDAQGNHYREETMLWNRLYVDEEQLFWLANDLAGTKKRTVVFTHGNLDCRMWRGKQDPHVVKNQAAVRTVLEESGKVLAVLQGHCHSGALSVENGIPYLTLQALVDGRKKTPVLLLETEEQMDGMLVRSYDLAEKEQKEQGHSFLL